MVDQQFCLRWSNHQSTLISVFDKLLENGTLVDCTLSAEGEYQRAHRMVLCASGPYFETLLSNHHDKHPIVILTNVKSRELNYIMDYMYRGEVNIPQDHLKSFLKTADSLQIKGLPENCANNDSCNILVTPVKHSAGISRHLVLESENPACSSIDDRVSPSRKRRCRRNSKDSNFTVEDTLLDNSNSYSPLRQVQLIHNTPNISDVDSSPGRNIIIKQEATEMANQTSMDSSLLQPGSITENTELTKPLKVPKTECLDLDTNSKDSVEDFTLGDDNDDMNKTDMQNLPMPHESFIISASATSNQTFVPWQFETYQSLTGNVSMATQESESAHRRMSCSNNDNTNSKHDDNDEMNKSDIQYLPMPHESFNASAFATPNQTLTPCQLETYRSLTGEVSMALQEAESAYRSMSCSNNGNTNSKDDDNYNMNRTDAQNLPMPHKSFNTSASATTNHMFTKWRYRTNHGYMFKCSLCGQSYQHKGNLNKHKCGDKRLFGCSMCPFTTKHKASLRLHVYRNHM